MKINKTKKVLLTCLLAVSGATLVACDNKPETSIINNNSTTHLVDDEIGKIYELYRANNGDLSYEDWLRTIKGEKGDKGDTGAKGDTGEKGEKGDKGDTGAKGDKGDKGDTGAKGDKGDTGATGAKGDKGDTGATGAKGDIGDKGDTGDVGATAYSSTILPSSYGYVVPSVGSAVVGEDITFDVYADDGFKLNMLTLNGVDVTKNVVDGKITVPMVAGGYVVKADFIGIVSYRVNGELKNFANSEEAFNYLMNLNVTEETTVVLNDDLLLPSTLTLKPAASMTLDLNGHHLIKNFNSKYAALVVATEDQLVTVKNGNINDSEVVGSYTAGNIVEVNSGKALFDHVSITNTNHISCAIYLSGEITEFTLKNSIVDVNAYYGVSTNNTTGKGLSINIDSSRINVHGDDYDSCGVLVNTVNTVSTIKDSFITGSRQGVIARLVDMSIENTTITLTGQWLTDEANRAINDKYLNGAWKSGDEVISAALVVGDRCDGAYNGPAKVDLKNVTLAVTDTQHGAYQLVKSEDKGTKITVGMDEITEKSILSVHSHLSDDKLN